MRARERVCVCARAQVCVCVWVGGGDGSSFPSFFHRSPHFSTHLVDGLLELKEQPFNQGHPPIAVLVNLADHIPHILVGFGPTKFLEEPVRIDLGQ